ncbi:DUF6602 domain-containing protein [Geodermatophilus pulveris]|uniref:DUF6602 domain-containing protein n=1 Tax=Geodermatophilus pulveris TaxID=1564159 RepID=UPI00117BDE59|nr:DUF6602 domain-containing protein [Geodermatophilus pulveris]
MRRLHRDSAVLGRKNEDIVAGFLRSTLRGRVVTRSSVIDSSGLQSGEIDVLVCNEDQPLLGNEEVSDLLIVEGVDVAVQVKARLTGPEVERIRDNCMSVKMLHKLRAEDDDYRSQSPSEARSFLDHVPYLVFCFDTALSASTAVSRLNEALEDVHPEYRPDAVVVLGKYSLINVRDWQTPDRVLVEPTGFVASATGELALADFMFCVFTYPPRIRRRWHPLVGYWRAAR